MSLLRTGRWMPVVGRVLPRRGGLLCRLLSPAIRSRMSLRWAAQQVEATMTTRHRRKPRGGSDEVFEEGMARVVDELLLWSRLIHKVPRLREPTDL